MKTPKTLLVSLAALALASSFASPVGAQPPQFQRPPQFESVEYSPERKLTFRLLAPKATDVRLGTSDLPVTGFGGVRMKKGESGIWEVTIGPVPAGAYRYNFSVDGITALDPKNPATSESMGNSWSLAVVPGAEWMDTKNVPHGAVASITYHSTALGKARRMHVYTPPGYEKGSASYPVFYLLHGAGDSDDSWTSVGRAGFILDNLIAAGKAKPMIVVMPAGHTGPFGSGGITNQDAFVSDFNKDIQPYIEKTYRTKNDRASRAIAGLSMGGFQTLAVAIPRLADFGYIGVYSSGLFGIVPMGAPGQTAPPAPARFPWEEQNKAILDNAALKKGLKLVWFGIGKDDFLLTTSNATVALLTKHGFTVTNHETGGGHTWLNWRDYLIEFAPKLFR
ncbi:esterase [Armatimonas rosea]|uniref:Enterochelin esterase family protein n=1 Tax=Armatimonas rosea TaxID=685828 RepID=A0A7W9SS10_ARMRO|nr:esterase [Armatimonas rosea]MBB6051173.1 enterochelin esterase family protein [Armatimonas rosea]